MAKKNKRGATEDALGLLHEEFAKILLEDLKKQRYVDEKGKEHIPTALYNVVRQFLRDNHIEKIPGDYETDPLGVLQKKAYEFDPDEFDDDEGLPLE